MAGLFLRTQQIRPHNYTHNVAPSSGIVDNWTYTRFWVYVFLLYSEVFMHCFLHQYNDAYLRTK